MDRRSLLKMFAVAGAAAAVLRPATGDAMPIAAKDGVTPMPTLGDPAVATDKDLEAAAPEKTYWYYRRRRFYRRYFYRPRYYRRYYYRPRYRYFRRRFFY